MFLGQHVRSAALSVTGVIVVSVLVASVLIWKTGYSIPQMDWDLDGNTSLSEMFDAIDIGHRSINNDEMICQEYFRLKDGIRVRLDCPL